jgi:hypothetical protein
MCFLVRRVRFSSLTSYAQRFFFQALFVILIDGLNSMIRFTPRTAAYSYYWFTGVAAAAKLDGRSNQTVT